MQAALPVRNAIFNRRPGEPEKFSFLKKFLRFS
jgi:hypothetical protein